MIKIRTIGGPPGSMRLKGDLAGLKLKFFGFTSNLLERFKATYVYFFQNRETAQKHFTIWMFQILPRGRFLPPPYDTPLITL